MTLPWRASVFSLMPDMFPGPLGLSLSGDALSRGLWALDVNDIRNHGIGKHRNVDDSPAGGGPGMVIRATATVRTNSISSILAVVARATSRGSAWRPGVGAGAAAPAHSLRCAGF